MPRLRILEDKSRFNEGCEQTMRSAFTEAAQPADAAKRQACAAAPRQHPQHARGPIDGLERRFVGLGRLAVRVLLSHLVCGTARCRRPLDNRMGPAPVFRIMTIIVPPY